MKTAILSILKNFRFRSKSFRLYWILLLLVLSLVIPAVFLRGTLPQHTATQIDGLAEFASIQGASLGPVTWRETFNNTPSVWSAPTNPPHVLSVSGSLKLSVTFPSSSKAQAISVSRNVSWPLNQTPIITITARVSTGVSYGVRFFGVTANNTSFAAWREGSPLQHRPGLGTLETVSANLVTETFLANPKLLVTGARITEVLFYIEAAPFTSGNFSLTLYDLHLNPTITTPADSLELNGNFTGLIANLKSSVSSQDLFQVFVGLDIKGSSDLSYTLYLTRGASIVAQGYTYVPKLATTYELALMSPSLVNSSPLFAGNLASSSLIVSAWKGEISFFRLDSVDIRFLTTTPAPSAALSTANYNSLVFYYFVFLFVIPSSTIVLLIKVFRDED